MSVVSILPLWKRSGCLRSADVTPGPPIRRGVDRRNGICGTQEWIIPARETRRRFGVACQSGGARA